jgi:hypothetical protein
MSMIACSSVEGLELIYPHIAMVVCINISLTYTTLLKSAISGSI